MLKDRWLKNLDLENQKQTKGFFCESGKLFFIAKKKSKNFVTFWSGKAQIGEARSLVLKNKILGEKK